MFLKKRQNVMTDKDKTLADLKYARIKVEQLESDYRMNNITLTEYNYQMGIIVKDLDILERRIQAYD